MSTEKNVKNLTNFLIENVILDYEEENPHTFYVDYSFSDGLSLHIDMTNNGFRAAVCGVNKIFDLFLKEQRRLSTDEIINKTSL